MVLPIGAGGACVFFKCVRELLSYTGHHYMKVYAYLALYFLLQNIETHHFHIQYVDVGVVLDMMNIKLTLQFVFKSKLFSVSTSFHQLHSSHITL
jgi:hypothetical protein